MATPTPARGADGDAPAPGTPSYEVPTGAPPTYATFSPATLSTTTPNKLTSSSSSMRRSTILVHQKSPLLLATPPQITRALAYSHPFLLPLNKLVGLLSWTTGDPWESFILLSAFWAVVLYGDVAIRTAGPIVLVLGLILGMYSRRYSPLSSSGWTEPAREVRDGASVGGGSATTANGRPQKPNARAGGGGGAASGGGHQRAASEATNTRHQKTLDEIVETLREFTGRCNILLEPLLVLTDFLSTQRTPTSATTRPALTTLFIRILLCTPFWVAMTLPPLRIITTRRVILVIGTLVLSWHSRAMRVARTILWRSDTIRRLAMLVTGFTFDPPMKASQAAGTGTVAEAEGTARSMLKRHESELTKALKKQSSQHYTHQTRGAASSATGKDAGLRFTFIIYENQRRWVGLGWTTSLFAYERPAWSDEHNNAVPARDSFELPEVEDGSRMRWRWVKDSRWKVDGVPDEGEKTIDYDGEAGRMGWIYYDNKWQNGRRGQDGWGRWTRRRKWYRDAELVEVDDEDEGVEPDEPPKPHPAELNLTPATPEATRSQPQLPLQPPTPTSNVPSARSYSTLEEKMMMASPGRTAPMQMPAPRFDASGDPGSSDGVTRRPTAGSSRTSDSGTSAKGGDDSASVMSTSSKSFFRTPSLRKRGPGGPERTSTAASIASADRDREEGRRRASEVKSAEEAAALGLEVELRLQGAGKEGRWGIGDEAEMSLE